MRIMQSVMTIAASFMLLATSASTAPLKQDQIIRLPVRQADIEGVEACIRSPSDDCRKCRESNQSNLSLMNYTLLHEALHAGGIKAEVEPVISPNSERSRKMIASGMADIKTDWAFNISGNDDFLKTDPLLRAGEIEKGLYAPRGFMEGKADNALPDIHTLRAVGIRNWRLDWQVLESLPLASLTNAATVKQMFSIINAGRADFTLLEFSSRPDMGREVDGIWLYPIPGIKVSLPETQHFMVSRKLKDADKVIEALNRGIKTLRDNGFIRLCLMNNGVIHPEVEDWHTLNATAETVDKDHPTVSSQ
ncbi:hypothetical protein SAMN02744133_10552 [Thalassospira xiamenensis M-5 = DSM 17429]|jgi:hypothetical protein|uniref:Solute-binding protein family 3/N-terminal domain-containing protein n=2 Tax=Thalassospira xiamenensis TaxID=220697 RepID=A0AB72UGU2_9PROT|nr:hypothetical protein [Thalassospira xiamenensis]AJD53432.1 hypothetical protein TH3_16650 [Thalassospira xiamenensis M-5 = DSM 17429]SIT06241.1 hypothetical protein SAMN02744133_10552 [Thalassospira xiamenensis M-5 = DSM 17429]HBN48915.1 hypothetical protein [Thalassospira sp.]|tara:strand:- start:259 stop:1176 length:918 start_codon:yes stop_codon:yes gene_type:complete